MSEQLEVEKWVIDQFVELTNHGFSEPVIKREDWNTVINWFSTDIAIELEFDWREFDVFLLVVKLDNGQLPQGYYVPCRFHLEKVIIENEWIVSQDEMKYISFTRKHGRLQKPGRDNFRQRVLAYEVVLMSCINQILTSNKTIFTKYQSENIGQHKQS